MKIHNMEQRSPEWYAIRLGIPTASAADKLVTPTGKLSAQSRAYMCQLLADRAGFPEPPMEPTQHMLDGIEREPESRALFEYLNDAKITEVGFVTNDEGTAGLSPDGLILSGNTPVAGWETKSPMAKTHIGYLLDGGLPNYYKPQVHYSMAVTGLNKWWFQSYFPGLEPLIVLVEADEYTAKIKQAVKEFTDQLEAEAIRLGITTKGRKAA